MKKYKVICVDMFQTLVDINSRREIIWKRILGDNYSESCCAEYAHLAGKNIVNRFHEEFSKANDFRNLRSIFESSFEEIFRYKGISYCPKNAAQIFIEEHNHAQWYWDSIAFIDSMRQNFKLCLLSDADNDMVSDLVKNLKVDKIVISEDVRSYKRNRNGKMFKAVIEYFDCNPNDILHVGDSSSDIIGASRQHIDTCWINRHNYKKKFNIEATYEVINLLELEKLLLERK